MKFSKEAISYLKGEIFSNGIYVPISEKKDPIKGRLSFLIDLARGKNIVHLGCADHIEIIDSKIKSNNWLHKLLVENSKKCIGIDNNAAAIEHIKMRGFDDVYLADITNQPALEVVTSQKWDYLVMGEIIEHISNPALFLNELRLRYSSSIDKIILTTPHAFRIKNFTRAVRKNREIINSDHRFWFTPYTLAKISIDAGLVPEDFWLVENAEPQKLSIIKRILLKLYPSSKDTIVMICRFNP